MLVVRVDYKSSLGKLFFISKVFHNQRDKKELKGLPIQYSLFDMYQHYAKQQEASFEVVRDDDKVLLMLFRGSAVFEKQANKDFKKWHLAFNVGYRSKLKFTIMPS